MYGYSNEVDIMYKPLAYFSSCTITPCFPASNSLTELLYNRKRNKPSVTVREVITHFKIQGQSPYHSVGKHTTWFLFSPDIIVIASHLPFKQIRHGKLSGIPPWALPITASKAWRKAGTKWKPLWLISCCPLKHRDLPAAGDLSVCQSKRQWQLPRYRGDGGREGGLERREKGGGKK